MSRPDASLDHVTPYDRLVMTDVMVEHMLVSGEHRNDLIDYFGAEEYADLVRLAKRAHQTPLAADAIRVFIVPGIMGSQLGMFRQAPLPNDVLWLDPIDISHGRLAALRIEDESPIVTFGVVLYSYLRLKLQLRAAGYSPVFHEYDWRLGIDGLGSAFAERVRKEPAQRVMIVAHSMGGLVARAAIKMLGRERVERVVLLGTPNGGSFAPVLALRGVYAVVRKIARLDMQRTAEWLASEVFNTFPSLYHMLPPPTGELDFFDAAHWPVSGPRPVPELLQQARAIPEQLAPADERFVVVVGVNQETVTGVAKRGKDFVYTITRRGDGTVPADLAELSGARTYYVKVAHSDLTRDSSIAAAIVDLLRKGVTRKLEAEWRYTGRAEARISDTQLRKTHTGKVDWASLEPEERRTFLQTLNEPPKLQLRVPGNSPRKRATR